MKWSVIRSLGRVKYFGLSYVVLVGIPVLASIYDYSENLPFLGPLFEEFPTNLKLLYLSSLLYAIGVACYQILCPEEIKAFPRDTDYVHRDLEIALRTHPTRKLEVVLAQLSVLNQELQDKITRLNVRAEESGDPGDLTELQKTVDVVYPSCVQHFLTAEYARRDESLPIARNVCFVAYLGGSQRWTPSIGQVVGAAK